jgi:hypothetical protein
MRGWPITWQSEARVKHRHGQSFRQFVDLCIRYCRGAYRYQALPKEQSSGTMIEDISFLKIPTAPRLASPETAGPRGLLARDGRGAERLAISEYSRLSARSHAGLRKAYKHSLSASSLSSRFMRMSSPSSCSVATGFFLELAIPDLPQRFYMISLSQMGLDYPHLGGARLAGSKD